MKVNQLKKTLSFADIVRRALAKKFPPNWGTSKHHGSHHWLSRPQRRAGRKIERQRRKRGRHA